MNSRVFGLALSLAFLVGLPALAQEKESESRETSRPASQNDDGKAASTDDTAAKRKDDPADSEASKSEDAPKDQDKPAAKDTKKASSKAAAKPKLEKITFGGGCFWCMEAVFERMPGVKSVVSGYSGGHVANPTYEMVCSGLTGHAEVIQIEYDPSVVSFEKLLNLFWSAHDPTTLNQQEDDFGTQYRSIILYHTEDQKEAALASYRDLTKRKVFKSPIVTELEPFTAFYPAEAYHQDYYRNNPYKDYSQIYIVPKLRKLKQKLK